MLATQTHYCEGAQRRFTTCTRPPDQVRPRHFVTFHTSQHQPHTLPSKANDGVVSSHQTSRLATNSQPFLVDHADVDLEPVSYRGSSGMIFGRFRLQAPHIRLGWGLAFADF
jgi:hypothetical protein